jgi:DNA-binding transcriptional LysR family regulator
MNFNRFDLVTLRLFKEIAESRSITHGAMNFGLAIAAASRRVSELELGVGTRLLLRSKKGVQLTQAGTTLLQYVNGLVKDLETLAVLMEDYRMGVRGHVRVWTNPSAVIGYLPPVIAAFTRKHRNIKIDLEEANSDEVIRAIGEGRADLGIFAENSSPHNLETHAVHVDELVLLLGSPVHPLTRRKTWWFRDALSFDFVGLDRSSSLLQLLLDAANEAKRPLRLRVQVRSFQAICLMVAADLGIGVLPRSAVLPFTSALKLEIRPLRDAWAKHRLLVGVTAAGHLDEASKALFHHLIESPTFAQ